MTKIEFGTPPPVTRATGPREATLAVLEALEARPGEWAKVEKDVAPAAGAKYRKLGCETRLDRTRADLVAGKVDLWARFVDEDTEDEDEDDK